MTSWEQFATTEPEMAKVLRHLLGWIPIAYLATVRRDGSPRVHPFCPIFAEDGIYIAIRPDSPKRHDLRRDGRYAMHALPGKRDDEFYMSGRASLVSQAARRKAVVEGAGHTVHADDDVFELHPEYAMTAYWENQGQPDTYAVRKEWRAAGVPPTAPQSNGAVKSNRVNPAPRARAASGSRATRKGS